MSLVNDDGKELVARPYQAELEEIALKRNTIIHLPTGSGKTFIAIRMIQHFRTAIIKPWNDGGKRTFFLVNTVPLVIQQKKVIENYLPVIVAGYSSEDRVDYWNKQKWDEELTKYEVFVMTSQILADMLTHAYIRIEDINLLIFDECHHAVDDHPMRLIMKYFENCQSSDQPRVLGLTATLFNKNVLIDQIETSLKTLETTFHATIATVNDLGEVLKFSTNPRESILHYQLLHPTDTARCVVQHFDELLTLITAIELPKVFTTDLKLKPGQQDITVDPKKVNKAVASMVKSMQEYILEMGIFGGNIAVLAYMIMLERLKRKAQTEEEEMLYKIVITSCTEARMLLIHAMKNDNGFEQIVKHSSDKVIKLLNVLKEYNPDAMKRPGNLLKVNCSRNQLCGIVFTRKRFTAKILYNLLKEVKKCNSDFDFIQHEFLVGFNIDPFKNTREGHYIKKTSQKALLKFRNGELNLLISTSVIEEGVDMPQCALVVLYDSTLEYRSYIQSKGRARSAESSFVIFVSEADKTKFSAKYRTYNRIENQIQTILTNNSEERVAPTLEDITEDLYEDDDVKPFIAPSGVRLPGLVAIRLLSRYCNNLNYDRFSVITPIWIQERNLSYSGATLRKVTVIMPLDCPVKEEVSGLPQKTLKNAKRSAALNVCIRLYQEGELDPLTLLPIKQGHVDYDDETVQSCFPNWVEENLDPEVPKPGSRKRVRKHKIEFSSFLRDKPHNETYYLHIIEMKTTFPAPTESRPKTLYDFLQKKGGYGFITPNPLPNLCNFPMYLKSGEVTTSILTNHGTIQLDQDVFELIKEFHCFIFDEVLAVMKRFVVFEGKENCMYAVPVKEDNGYDIDWDVIMQPKTIPPVSIPSAQERKSLKVTQESYHNAIVTPWYRTYLHPDRYVVSKVLEHKTPRSVLSSDSDTTTYTEYYLSKYNLEIVGDQTQPLLEVLNISSRMNCLLPKASTINQLTDKQKKLISLAQDGDSLKNFEEVFIPEFCIKYDYPAILWYKAMILPSILHRVHMLLVSQELLMQIAKGTNYGNPCLKSGEVWEPIITNTKKVIKSLLAGIEMPASSKSINESGTNSVTGSPKTTSMKKNLYQLQQKQLAKDYPWEESSEPMDIERNLTETTIMDIACYDEFVSALLTPPKDTSAVVASVCNVNVSKAISAPPLQLVSELKLLKNQPTGRGPELRDMLTSLTTINSNDNFDYERLEALGDSFLKYASSIYLFHKFPKFHEGQLTNVKCRLVSNRNLYYAGERINLAGRMKVKSLSPRDDFMVPGFFVPSKVKEFIEDKQIRPTFLIGVKFPREEVLRGELSEESLEAVKQKYIDCNGTAELESEGRAQNVMQCYLHDQAVPDKSVADCVEAIIGTYLLSGGLLAAVKIVEWLRIIPAEEKLATLFTKPVVTAFTLKKAPSDQFNLMLNHGRNEIEKIMNYQFKDPALLLEAMSHPSYNRNRLTGSYERLEFIGDAILDFMITIHIFENCPDLDPGDITNLRSALVNNSTFAAYCVKLGLHKYMCSGLDPALYQAIGKFVEHQQARDHDILEDVMYLVTEADCSISEYIDVPKVLSDIFEAVTGAIYLDCGGKLDVVWSVIYRIMRQEIYNFSKRIPRQPVAVLYEDIHASASFGKTVVTEHEPPKTMIPVSFTKEGSRMTVYGVGLNKFQAKRAAAKLALKILAS